MSHYITCPQCFEPTMDVANLTCDDCGYESGMSETKALGEKIKMLEAELLQVKAERDGLLWLTRNAWKDHFA